MPFTNRDKTSPSWSQVPSGYSAPAYQPPSAADLFGTDWAGRAYSMWGALTPGMPTVFSPHSGLGLPDLAPAGQYYVYPDGNMSNLKGPGATGPFTQEEAQSKAFAIKGGNSGSSGGTTGLEPILGSFASQKGQAGIVAEDSQMGYPSWMTTYPNAQQNWQDLWG